MYIYDSIGPCHPSLRTVLLRVGPQRLSLAIVQGFRITFPTFPGINGCFLVGSHIMIGFKSVWRDLCHHILQEIPEERKDSAVQDINGWQAFEDEFRRMNLMNLVYSLSWSICLSCRGHSYPSVKNFPSPIRPS